MPLHENRLAGCLASTTFPEQLDPYIGHLPLKNIHHGTLAQFIADWRRRGLSNRTINIAIARVRRIVRLAAMRWRDENNLTWLDVPPSLTMLNERKRGEMLTRSPGNSSESSSRSCRDTCTGWRFSRSIPGAASRKSLA